MAELKYKGNQIRLGGTDWRVPSLSVGQAVAFDEHIAEIEGAISDPTKVTFAMVAKWLPIFLAAIQRNYPDATLEFLQENIDLNNFAEVRNVVLGYRKESATLGE